MAPDANSYSYRNTDMTVLEWLITFVILLIPGLNIVFCIIWSTSSRIKISKQSFARAFSILVVFLAIVSLALFKTGVIGQWAEGKVGDAITRIIYQSKPKEIKRDYRMFTDTNGREIEAKVLTFRGNKVRIQRKDDIEFEIDINRFSEIDRRYLLDLRERMEAAAAAAISEESQIE